MKYFYPILKFSLLLIFTSCSHQAAKPRVGSTLTVFKISNPPLIGTTRAGQSLYMGGFSSLSFTRKVDGKLFFNTITDRGPNPEEFSYLSGVGKNVRPFLLPDYAPSLVELGVDLTTNTVTIEKIRPFKHSVSKKLTGLPPQNSKPKNKHDSLKYEIAIDAFGNPLVHPQSGIDSEGFCAFNDTFLVSEEYNPELLQFDANLVLLKRWTPGRGLPAELSTRKSNRGLEGLACNNQYAYLMMQSPLKSELDQDVNKVRIIKFNPLTGKTIKEYFYPVQKSIADKIGDLTLISNEKFLVIEQNGKLEKEEGVRRIYEIDLATADEAGQLTKKLILDLNELGFDFVEKIEGITLINENTLALISDNDFGLESQVDLATGKFRSKADAFSYLAIIQLERGLLF